MATRTDGYNFFWDIISRSDSSGINTFIVQETQSEGIRISYHPVGDNLSGPWVTDTTIIPATVRYFNLLEDANHIITRSGNSVFWPGSINRFYSDTSYSYSYGYTDINYKLREGVGITEWNYYMAHSSYTDVIHVKLLSNSFAP
jgi:hypothetical protein